MWGLIPPKDLKPLWRIEVAVVCSVLVGGLTGRRYFTRLSDLNLFLGGALAMPVGFLLGLIWHCCTSRSESRTDWLLVSFLGLVAAAVAVFASLLLSADFG